MNHFVSTYRRDYTWPQMSRACELPPPQIAKSIVCICTQSRKALDEVLKMREQPDDRSCISRMELPLKLCFTKNKLKSKPLPVKYPDSCRQFRDEKSALVNASRFKTTYQVDFSDPASARMARRDKPLTIVKKDSQQLCCLPIKITIEPDFRPYCHSYLSSTDESRSKVSRAKTCSRDVPREKTTKCGEKRERDEEHFPTWKSEYQDTVDEIDRFVIKAKLHHSKRNIVPVYITSK